MEKVVREIEKGPDLLRIELSEFQGKQYIGARIYFMDDRGEWKPSKKGLTLAPDMMTLVHEALGDALRELSGS